MEFQPPGSTETVQPQTTQNFIGNYAVRGVERYLKNLPPEQRTTQETLIKSAKSDLLGLCKKPDQQLSPVQQRVLGDFLEQTLHGDYKTVEESQGGSNGYSSMRKKRLFWQPISIL